VEEFHRYPLRIQQSTSSWTRWDSGFSVRTSKTCFTGLKFWQDRFWFPDYCALIPVMPVMMVTVSVVMPVMIVAIMMVMIVAMMMVVTMMMAVPIRCGWRHAAGRDCADNA